MPYNTTAIPPAEEITGHSALPLARVKKIIRLDDEVAGCSNSAAFLVTIAAEMFVQYLAEQGLKMTYGDRKQRKTMQYKDLANAVARIDNLEFLSDVIPQTVPYKQVQEKKKKAAKDAEKGQQTLQRVLPVGAANGRKNGTPRMKKVTPEIEAIVEGAGEEGSGEEERGEEMEMVEEMVERMDEEETPSRKTGGGGGLERFAFGGGSKS